MYADIYIYADISADASADISADKCRYIYIYIYIYANISADISVDSPNKRSMQAIHDVPRLLDDFSLSTA